MDDVQRLRAELVPIEVDARSLHWARERPWRVTSHVSWQAGLPTIDAHDLSAKLFKRTLRLLVSHAERLDSGAVRIITGRGRHSLGPCGVLGQVLQGSLGRQAAARGWALRHTSPGAWILVVDPHKAPAALRPGIDWALWALAALIAGGAVIAIANLMGR